MEAILKMRRAGIADAEVMASISEASPGAARWTAEDYRTLLAGAGTGRGLVAEMDGAVAGFLCCRLMGEEAEILNVAVDGQQRRKSVARRLLAGLIEQVRGEGAKELFLEVQEDNEPVRRLYLATGFQIVGRRKNYYQSPAGDALQMRYML